MNPIGPIELVRLRVRDLGAAKIFYGKTLKLTLVAADAQMAIFDTGQAKLVIEQGAASPSPAIELGFTVTSIETAVATAIAEGVKIIAPPVTEAWGGRVATIADPDGNRLSLIQYP
jgi:predicted enzyme related to lactoylglutathione lyase